MPAKYKKRPDGRYLIQIMTGRQENGKPIYKSIYAYTVRELEEKAAAFRQEMERGIVVDDEGLTVTKWARKWFETYKAGKAHNTRRMYKTAIETHIIPAIGHYRLRELKPHHVQELINKKHNEGLTKTLINIKLTLGQILGQAVKNEYIYKNIMDSVELPSIKKRKKRSLTDAEQSIILNADLSPKERVFLLTLLFTGIRRGEALILTKNDVDLVKRTLTVNKTVVFIGNHPELKPMPKSEAGNRVIPLPDILLTDLTDYLQNVKGIYVFPSASGELMTETAYRRFWDKIMRNLNLAARGKNGRLKILKIAQDITPHIFRHTYATSLYYAGVDMKTAQYLLGHASIQMTMDIYTELNTDKNVSAASQLDDYYLKLVSQKSVSDKK